MLYIIISYGCIKTSCFCLPDSMKQLTFDLATRDILQCPRTLFSPLIKTRHVGKLSQDTFRDFILQYNGTKTVNLAVRCCFPRLSLKPRRKITHRAVSLRGHSELSNLQQSLIKSGRWWRGITSYLTSLSVISCLQSKLDIVRHFKSDYCQTCKDYWKILSSSNIYCYVLTCINYPKSP